MFAAFTNHPYLYCILARILFPLPTYSGLGPTLSCIGLSPSGWGRFLWGKWNTSFQVLLTCTCFFKQTYSKMALSIISLVQFSKMGYHYETFKMFNISSQLCTGCFSLPVWKFIIRETNKQGYFVSNVTYWKVKSSTISSVHSFTVEFAFFVCHCSCTPGPSWASSSCGHRSSSPEPCWQWRGWTGQMP